VAKLVAKLVAKEKQYKTNTLQSDITKILWTIYKNEKRICKQLFCHN